MKSFVLALFALTVLLSPGFAAKKPKRGPEALVVSDAIEKMPEEFLPAPGRPVHYVILGSAERTLGASIAGEPQPDRAVLESEVIRVLATQGFVRTQIGGPMPQLALIITWGSANLMIDDFEETDDEGETFTSSLVWNRREINFLVGAYKANQRLMSSADAEAINDAARQDRLYLMISAFDAVALVKKEKKILWRTRVSIDSLRNSLPESLNVMLASAAPYLGRDTERPVFVDDNIRRKAEVHIGTPVVVPSDEKK